MAQPQQHQQQYPPRPYSPLQPAQHGLYPPNKRQRMSPNRQPGSPYSSPSPSNIALPNQIFSSPYYGNSPNLPNGLPLMNAQYPPPHPSPQPQLQLAGTMGPPQRPLDNKPTDMNEISDVLHGVGVDLREEEAALSRSSLQKLDTSFGSNSSAATLAGGPGYNVYSQNYPGDRNMFYGGGTLNQPAVPLQTLEEKADADKRKAIRRQAEIQQYHLNDPFLFGGSLQRRLTEQTHTMQVKYPSKGHLSLRQGDASVDLLVFGPDKNEVLVNLKGQGLLTSDAPIVEFLALISLATEERIRAVVEDAAALAKGRRVGSQGIVPSSLADLADGVGARTVEVPPVSADSPKSSALKRSYSEMNDLPTPETPPQPVTTVAFPNRVAQALHQLGANERSAEEERLIKRRRRADTAKANVDSANSNPTSQPGSAPATPGLLAPDVDVKKSKKEKRTAEVRASEAQQHAAANKTMNMALGGAGGLGGLLGGKKLAWMNKDGAASVHTNPMLPRGNAGQSSSRREGPPKEGLPPPRVYGILKEDKEDGSGIQLKDMVSVLEKDRKEKKALAKAFMKMGIKEKKK